MYKIYFFIDIEFLFIPKYKSRYIHCVLKLIKKSNDCVLLNLI